MYLACFENTDNNKINGMKVSLESEWYEECLSDILVLSIEI